MGPSGPLYPGYSGDPLGYARDILGITLTDGQERVLRALHEPPHRVLVSSGHSVGKSLLGAVLVNWFFDTREGLTLTTAPTDRQVKDILWKEVRNLRTRAELPDYWVGPKIPRLESSPTHFAHGFTARDSTRFHGHHSPHGLLIIFDEAEGVEAPFWEATKTMLDDQSFFVAFYNPTTPGSAAHHAEQQADEHGAFRRVTLSCLDHPNITGARHIPGAITKTQLRAMLLEDSQLLHSGDTPLPTDVRLDHELFRPGPIAEARCLGRRPTSAITGLWSEDLWLRVMNTRINPKPEWPVVIGCDVGRYGDDHSVIMVRKGFVFLHVESHVKQNTSFISRRLIELCDHFKDNHNPARRIVVHIDEGGVGSGVIDQADGHLFVPINAACKARQPARYNRVRDELWFTSRQAALEGLLDLSRLPQAYLLRLKQELMIAQYAVLPGTDKIKVMSKDDMKAMLGRSPDLADSFCLCVYPPGVINL